MGIMKRVRGTLGLYQGYFKGIMRVRGPPDSEGHSRVVSRVLYGHNEESKGYFRVVSGII